MSTSPSEARLFSAHRVGMIGAPHMGVGSKPPLKQFVAASWFTAQSDRSPGTAIGPQSEFAKSGCQMTGPTTFGRRPIWRQGVLLV
jgi:hypothetical protein